jgi:hypothetical protein
MRLPSDLSGYAEELKKDLEAIGLVPPPGFRNAFLREARRLGQESAEDFGSAYLLDCLKAKRKGLSDTQISSLTRLNTVRQRLVRQARKAQRAREAALSKELEGRDKTPQRDVAAIAEFAEFAEALRNVFSELGVMEKIVLEGMLQDKTLKESARDANMTHDAARQLASRLRKKIRPWLARFEELVKE